MFWLTPEDAQLFRNMAQELRRVAAELRTRTAPGADPTGPNPARLEEYASAIVRDLNFPVE